MSTSCSMVIDTFEAAIATSQLALLLDNDGKCRTCHREIGEHPRQTAAVQGGKTDAYSSAHFVSSYKEPASYLKSRTFLSTVAHVLRNRHDVIKKYQTYDSPTFGDVLKVAGSEVYERIGKRDGNKRASSSNEAPPKSRRASSGNQEENNKSITEMRLKAVEIANEFDNDEWEFLITLNKHINNKLHEPFVYSGETPLTLVLPPDFYYRKDKARSIAKKLAFVNDSNLFHVENAAHASGSSKKSTP